MAPRTKISKEDIINASFEITRNDGISKLNARNIAATLDCSTQPIFSNFTGMDEIFTTVIEKAEELYDNYIREETESGKYPPYKASGMAYIRFAKEEKELFKLLFMRDRSKESITEDTERNNKMEDMIYANTGLKGEDAKLFHLEMWAYVHGIASMIVTNYFTLDTELISKLITDCYLGLKKQHESEGKNGSDKS